MPYSYRERNVSEKTLKTTSSDVYTVFWDTGRVFFVRIRLSHQGNERSPAAFVSFPMLLFWQCFFGIC